MVPAPSMDWVPRPRLVAPLRHADLAVGSSATSTPRASGRPLNILCMDGGGMRGLNLLVLAEEIELQTGKPLASLFDLVAGTSIGGCGALFINKYPAPGEATRMARLALRELQHRCFGPSARSRSSLFWKGHLCLDRRREFMLEICGQAQPLRLPKGERQPTPFLFADWCSGAGCLGWAPHGGGPLALSHVAHAPLARLPPSSSP